MILLEVNSSGLESFVVLILGVMFGPPFILGLLGLILRLKYKKTGKVLLILSVVYLLVAGGICGTLLSS